MIAEPLVTATPDAASAVDFLTALVPAGLLALASIHPGGGPLDGRTFDLPRERAVMAAWIEARQDVRNLYYTLNEPCPTDRQTGHNGRVREADVVRIRGLVLDIDPSRAEEEQPGGAERERARLLHLAADMAISFLGAPTAIVNSGSGIQAVYLFPEPVAATADAVRRVKAQARGLAKLHGSDPVQSLDHLFRVPFTVNLPDEGKRKRGRQRCFSSLLHLDAGERWSLENLSILAKPVHEPEVVSGSHAGLDLSDAMAVLGAPEALPPELLARLVAAQARLSALRTALDPDAAAARFGSDRSDRDFALGAACVEAGIADPVEVASVVAAYSPDKTEERGEEYLARTVSKVLARVRPGKDPTHYFEQPADDSQSKTSDPIRWIDPTKWEGVTPRPREWEVEGWIPKGEVTLLYGDGGIGKTLLIHGYATCAATGRDWLGYKTRPARVLCFFCEDSEDELHNRQEAINRQLGLRHTDLSNLRLTSRKGFDNALMLWERHTGASRRQAVWEQLLADAKDFAADVVIIDTIADTYVGSEIDRAQVSAFVKSCLGRLAQEIGGSVIALGHPSKSGKANGDGTSGSTAWNNAARSRLYLSYPGKTTTGDFRVLENKKSNYGARGGTIKVRWRQGTFEPYSTSTPHSGQLVSGTVPRSEDAAEQGVLSALISHGPRRLSLAKNSPHFAPKLLRIADPDALAPFEDKEVSEAIDRLLRKQALRIDTVERDTSRRPQQGLVTVSDKMLPQQTAAEGPEYVS